MLDYFKQIYVDFNQFLEYKPPASNEYVGIITIIRNAMVALIPILLIGAITLSVQFFPIASYQQFCASWFDGIIVKILSSISSVTFGFLSVYMCISISYTYIHQFADSRTNEVIGMMTSLSCFALMIGVFDPDFKRALLGAQGIASAIVSSICVGFCYRKMSTDKRFTINIFSDGSDDYMNVAISSTIPACVIIVVFAILNYAILKMFRVSNVHQIFVNCADWIFLGMGRGYFSGATFLFLSTLLWFVGIHGNNIFDKVANELFQGGMAINVAAVNAGQHPTEIVTKSFIDCFTLMGGCGSTICLLIALLLFSKRRNVRGLAKFAIFPMIFNINELMVFGLPIIFNRFFLIPFMLTPLILFSLSYMATSMGIVPIICNPDVPWTAPVLFSGYLATGSIAGVIMQILNIAVGVLIYWPFIRKYDKAKEAESKFYFDDLVSTLKKAQEDKFPIILTELKDSKGVIAKTLLSDLKIAVAKNDFKMFYQCQFDNNRKVISAESLLRWRHPAFGLIYPPLAVKLAEEAGIKLQMEKIIFEMVASKVKYFQAIYGENFHVSVNVTVNTLKSNNFETFLENLVKNYNLKDGDLMIEITEETNLSLDNQTVNLIDRIRKLGFRFALDDFAMGHTSLQYLQTNQFDEVKLDGSIIKGISDNQNLKDIVDSIIHLSKSMGFAVLAEYVQTEEEKQLLEQIGCVKYQGYLMGPAVTYDDFVNKFPHE